MAISGSYTYCDICDLLYYGDSRPCCERGKETEEQWSKIVESDVEIAKLKQDILALRAMKA